jgi:hypothetical protein
VIKEIKAMMGWMVSKAKRVIRVIRVYRALPEIRALKVSPANKAFLVQQALRVHKEILEQMGRKDPLAQVYQS